MLSSLDISTSRTLIEELIFIEAHEVTKEWNTSPLTKIDVSLDILDCLSVCVNGQNDFVCICDVWITAKVIQVDCFNLLFIWDGQGYGTSFPPSTTYIIELEYVDSFEAKHNEIYTTSTLEWCLFRFVTKWINPRWRTESSETVSKKKSQIQLQYKSRWLMTKRKREKEKLFLHN